MIRSSDTHQTNMSITLYNGHRSRYMSTMRHWWNKIFFFIIRVMIALNQAIVLAPFIYFRNTSNSSSSSLSSSSSAASEFPNDEIVKWKFSTHPFVTGVAIFLCLFYTLAAPFLVMLSSELYSSTRHKKDNLFNIIAQFTMTLDILFSIFIMASLILYRENVVKILNLFNELVVKFDRIETQIVGFKILATLVAKMCLNLYNLVLNVPFIIESASRLSNQSIVAFMFTNYIQELSSIFSISVFMSILLLLSFSLQLEKQLKLSANICNDLKMSQLISLQNSLKHLISLCVKTFQFGIFLVILLNFTNILCNIYAMLDFYVTNHIIFRTFITYILSIALELYSLVFAAHMCDRSQRRVKDLFLQCEELYFLKLPASYSIVETDVLWPQLQQFYILGLFHLNNEFALFLLAYSINFIVIILEFEVNKAVNKD